MDTVTNLEYPQEVHDAEEVTRSMYTHWELEAEIMKPDSESDSNEDNIPVPGEKCEQHHLQFIKV